MSPAGTHAARPAGPGRRAAQALRTVRLRELAAPDRPAGPPAGRRRSLLPSWLTSLWLHALILAAALVAMQHWRGFGARGEADGDSRVTGLITQFEGRAESDAPPGEFTVAPAESDAALPPTDLPSSDAPTDDAPPVDLAPLAGPDLPPVDGPGAAAPKFAPPQASSPPAAGGGGMSDGDAPPAGLARGDGGTSFFGIPERAEALVYVIDVSASMSDDDAIHAAKNELMASLGALRGDQRFQVIFYNDKPIPLRLPNRAPEKLFDATDLNKTLARQVISAVQADLGTRHMPALELALELRPDVIYFLTDADEPALSARDLDAVRRANVGGTRIHAVQFGTGANLDHSPSLERLAALNHGAYQYRDITKLDRH